MSIATTATPPRLEGSNGSVLAEHRACVKCGYDLFGLSHEGVCPECGSTVAESLRGILLQYASPEYLAAVRQGHSLVLNGILLHVLLTIATIGLTAAGGSQAWLTTGMQGVSLVASVLVFVGYLRLTVPDPQFTGTERPGSARAVVRGAALGLILLTLVQTGVSQMSMSTQQAPGSGLLAILIVLGLAGAVLWAIQFFAMMRYARWLATRVPDEYVVRRTKVYMWLLPVLATVGMLLAGLGPLIALVMYWNLLDRMRKHLKAIERTGEPARLKRMTAG